MNLSLFPDSPATTDDLNRYRTKSGDLKASVYKAISWVCIEDGLKPSGAGAYPDFSFIDRDGNSKLISVKTIVERYDEFKRRTHGKVAS